MNKEQYVEYLESQPWLWRRERVRRRAQDRCERCGNPHADEYHCHHLHYRTLGHEHISDLMYLCNECHAFVHGRSSFDPLAGEGRVKHPDECDRCWNEATAHAHGMQLCGDCREDLEVLSKLPGLVEEELRRRNVAM
jgi:hypothetical protein